MTLTLERPVTETEELVIVVTMDDIRNGNQRSSYSCPIALAAMRTHPEYDFQMGIPSLHRWARSGFHKQTVFKNEDAARWIRAFDNDKNSVAPERFIFRRA